MTEQFKLGTLVEAGNGEDHDTGQIVEATSPDDANAMASDPNTRFVAWSSGVSTWAHINDLKELEDY